MINETRLLNEFLEFVQIDSESGNEQKMGEKLVEVLRQGPYSGNAAIIGEVTEEQVGRVVMETEIGTQTLLPQPNGELLPRIC